MSDQRKSNPPSASLSSTRQLLDELDALMQRMLALPVGDADGTGAAAAAGTTSVLESPAPEKKEPAAATKLVTGQPEVGPPSGKPSSYTYEPPETVEEDDEAEPELDEEEGPEPAAGEEDDEADEEEAAETGEQDEAAVPVVFSGPISPVSSETLAALTGLAADLEREPLIQRSRLLAASVARRRPWWQWSLAVVNRVFDFFTYCLGPLGRWLRQPGGRTFLGWVGIAFLLTALGLQAYLWWGGN